MKPLIDYGTSIFSFDIRAADNRMAIAAHNFDSGVDIVVYDLSNLQPIFNLLIPHYDMFATVKFVTYNKVLVLIQNRLLLLNIETGEQTMVGNDVLQVGFGESKSSVMLLRDNPLRLELLFSDLSKLNKTIDIPHVLPNEEDNLYRFAISAKFLAVGGPKSIVIYNIKTFDLIKTIDHDATGVSVMSIDMNSEYIAFLGQNFKGSYLYALEDGKSHPTLTLFSPLANGFSFVTFAPTRENIFFGRQQGGCSGHDYKPDTNELFYIEDHDRWKWVNQISFSEDNKSMFTSGHDGKIFEYDLNKII